MNDTRFYKFIHLLYFVYVSTFFLFQDEIAFLILQIRITSKIQLVFNYQYPNASKIRFLFVMWYDIEIESQNLQYIQSQNVFNITKYI